MNTDFTNLHNGLIPSYIPNNVSINGMNLFYITRVNVPLIYMIIQDTPLSHEQLESLRNNGIINLIRMSRRTYNGFITNPYREFTGTIYHEIGTASQNIRILNNCYGVNGIYNYF